LKINPAPVPMSRRTLFLLQCGHFLIGSALIDWNFSNVFPHASHLYS
jgi:hypothetical protein